MNLPPPPIKLTLPPIALLTPGRSQGREIANLIGNSDSKKHRLLLGSVDLITTEEVCVISSFLGANAAQLILDVLVASNVSSILFVGFAGGVRAPDSRVEIGDILIPENYSISKDGVVPKLAEAIRPIKRFDALFNGLRNSQENLPLVAALSVNSPSHETCSFIQSAQREGFRTIDMESAYIAKYCSSHNMSFESALIISDLLGPNWRPSFSAPSVLSAMSTTLRLVTQNLLAR